jgi:hypothetical protein
MRLQGGRILRNIQKILPFTGYFSHWKSSISRVIPSTVKMMLYGTSFPTSAVTIESPAVLRRCLDVPYLSSDPTAYIVIRMTIISRIPGRSTPLR